MKTDPHYGKNNLSLKKQLLSGGLIIQDTSKRKAAALYSGHFKIIAELGDVVGLTKISKAPQPIRNKTAVTYRTSVNIVLERFKSLSIAPQNHANV